MGIGDAISGAWRRIKSSAVQTADVAWHAMPNNALAGFAIDLATAPWNDDEDYNGFLNTLQSRFVTRLGDVLEPIDIMAQGGDEAALEWLIPKYQRIRSYGLTRPLATLTLSADENVGTHGGSILNPGNWRDAWNASRDISPGQAWAGAIFGGQEATPGPIGTFAGQIGRLGDADFDITNPADRAAFHTGFGQWASGVPDAWLAWNFTDPIVLTGGAIGAARQAALVKPLEGARTGRLPNAAEGTFGGRTFNRGEYSGMDRKVIGAKPITPDEAMAMPRVTDMMARLAAMTPEQRATWLARNRTFMPNAGVQHLLADAKDADEIRFILRSTMDGSARNKSQLRDKSLTAEQKIDYIGDVRIPSIERALTNDVRMSPVMREVMEAEKAHLNRTLGVLDEELRFARLMESTAGKTTAVPRVTVGQRLTELGPTWAAYQPTRYGGSTRVLKSAGTRRAGNIDFNQPGSATEQTKRLLDRVGHGWEQSFASVWGATGRGVHEAEKGQLLAAVQRAEAEFAAGTGPVTAVQEAVKAAEAAAMNYYGKAFGLDAEVVNRLYLETAERRLAAGGTRGAERYSGVARPDRRPGEGKYVDQVYDNGTGELVFTPVTTSQFADSMQVLDVDAVARVMHRHRQALKGTDAKHIVARLNGTETSAFARGAAEEALQSWNRFWKPAQLFRLGWPMRVITDEQIRVLATVGLFTHLPVLAQSFAHSAKESRAGTAIRAGLSANERLVARHELAQRFGDKAADLERGTIVDKISGIDTMLAKLDGEINAKGVRMSDGQLRGAGQRLAAAAKANEGTRLYRVAPEKSKGKPGVRGVRYEVERNGRAHGPLRSGETVHTRLGHDIAEDTVFATTSRFDDPGISALDDLVGRKRHEDLMAMTNRDLRALLQREVGPGVSIARYKTKNELLSAYGAVLARRQGHTSIHYARGDEEAFVVLDDLAVRERGDDAFVAAADDLERLRITRDSLAAERAALTGREAALPPWNQQMQAEWDDLLSRAVDPRKRRKQQGPARKFTGTQTYTAAGGQAIRYDDAFEGSVGQVYLDLSSAGATMRSFAGLQDRYVNGLRLQTGEHKLLAPTTTETGTHRIAHEKSYAIGWEKATNDQLGKNPLARRILAGMDDDAVVTWLRRSKEGRALRAQHPSKNSDPRRWVEEVRQQVDTYLPTDALRQAALEGNATMRMLEQQIPDAAMRPVIHGEALELATGASKIAAIYDRAIGKIYQNLGTAPTDALSRHPFFTANYRDEMQRQIDTYLDGAPPGLTVSQDQIAQMQHRARQHALSETRRTLYDVGNSSNMAHVMRFTAPFYAAWQDALTTWARLWMEDPSRLGRMLQAWNAPSKAQITYEDAHGKTWVTLPLPDFVKDALPVLRGDMPANYLKSLIANGDYWMLPGAGAPVTMPIQQLTRSRPDLYPLLKPLIPYGAGEDFWDDFLPAGWKRAKTQWKKEDDYAWLSEYQRSAFEVYTERREGKFDGDDTAMYAEAERRTQDMFRIRMFANLTLPWSPNFRSPYQMYTDAAVQMREQYIAFPEGKDPNGKTWEEAFRDKWGEEYFVFTASLTKSNVGGISPTSEGFRATRKYADLISANPEYGSLIVGPEDEGEFNSEVYQWQRQASIGGGDTRKQRQVRSPQQAIRDAEISRGWDRFRMIDTYIDGELKKRGLQSTAAKSATDLRLMKKMAVEKVIKENPAWADSYGTFTKGRNDKLITFMETHYDELLKDRPGGRTLAEYLAARRTVAGMLGQRKSKNLQAIENTDLRLMWEFSVNRLRQADTDFADLHTRWLRNDNRLDEVG